jgi:hypothetical protein
LVTKSAWGGRERKWQKENNGEKDHDAETARGVGNKNMSSLHIGPRRYTVTASLDQQIIAEAIVNVVKKKYLAPQNMPLFLIHTPFADSGDVVRSLLGCCIHQVEKTRQKHLTIIR